MSGHNDPNEMSEGEYLSNLMDCIEGDDDEYSSIDGARQRALAVYNRNKAAINGSKCICPSCGKQFVKGRKNQAFCGAKKKGKSSCKDHYHNLVNEDRTFRAGLYS